MPANPTFTVKFKPEGDRELIQAINALARAQKKLEAGVVQSTTAINQSSVAKTKAAATTGILDTNHKRLAATNSLLANSFATLRSKLLLFSFGAMLVERAIVSMVRAYGMQEAANVKLQAGLANVQDTAKGTTQRLIDYSSALQQVTAFGDEVITTGMVQLTTFNLNEEAIKALTPQVLNVARAIQTASGTMPELNSLFIAFGKSTSTAVSALTRYGVVLTDTEKKQLELMDANTRALAVAEILEKQYGGIAAAYAKTTAGMLEATSAAFGDAKEAIGEAFAPLVLEAAKALKALAESIHPGLIRRWIDAAKIMVVVLGAIKTGLVLARLATMSFNMAIASTPWGLLAVVISVAASQLLKLGGGYGKTTEKIKDATKKIQENIKATAEFTDEQIAGEKALEYRLKLLKEEDPVMKILIALKHEYTEKEKLLATEIVATTEALKAQAEAEREIERATAKAQRELEAEAKRKEDQFKRLFPLEDEYIEKMEESRESHIHMQKHLKTYIALLDEQGIAHNLVTDATKKSLAAEAKKIEDDKKLIALEERKREVYKSFELVSLERQQLMDKEITFTEELEMLDLREAQAKKDLKTATDIFNESKKTNIELEEDEIVALGELNSIDKERISLAERITAATEKRNKKTQDDLDDIEAKNTALTLSQNALNLAYMEYNALLDGKVTNDEKLGMLAQKQLQLEIELAKAIEAKDLAKEASLTAQLNSVERERLDTLNEELELKKQLFDENMRAAALVVSSLNTAIGGIEANWRAFDNAEKKKELATARTQRQKDAIEEKYTKKAEGRAKKLKDWKVASAISNVALGITQTWRDESLPTLAKIALTILQAATGAAQVKTIRGQEFEQGGLIGGRRHSSGGTMINAEQGEFVMSRSAVESVGIENLNRMNEGGGGGAVTVNVSGNVLSQDFVEGELAENIKEAIRRGTDFGIS